MNNVHIFPITTSLMHDGNINPVIVKIFKVFNNLYTSYEQNSLRAIDSCTFAEALYILNSLGQKYFLRPGHISRKNIPRIYNYYHHLLFKNNSPCTINGISRKIFHLCTQLHHTSSILPTHTSFSTILVLGTSVKSLWERIAFVNKLIEEKKIILLPSTTILINVGERILAYHEIKEMEKLLRTYTTVIPSITDEREVGKLFVQFFPFSSHVDRNAIHCIETIKKPDVRRSTTADTIETWIRSPFFKKGSLLIVSNNPYTEYQRIITHLTLLSYNNIILDSWLEGAGPGMPSSTLLPLRDIGICLDTLARTIYALLQAYKLDQRYKQL